MADKSEKAPILEIVQGQEETCKVNVNEKRTDELGAFLNRAGILNYETNEMDPTELFISWSQWCRENGIDEIFPRLTGYVWEGETPSRNSRILGILGIKPDPIIDQKEGSILLPNGQDKTYAMVFRTSGFEFYSNKELDQRISDNLGKYVRRNWLKCKM